MALVAAACCCFVFMVCRTHQHTHTHTYSVPGWLPACLPGKVWHSLLLFYWDLFWAFACFVNNSCPSRLWRDFFSHLSHHLHLCPAPCTSHTISPLSLSLSQSSRISHCKRTGNLRVHTYTHVYIVCMYVCAYLLSLCWWLGFGKCQENAGNMPGKC